MALRWRILAAVVAAAAAAAAAVGVPLFLGAERIASEAAGREIGQLSARFDAAMAAETARAVALAAVVAAQPEVGRAMAEGDRQALIDAFAPGFADMKRLHGVVQVQFHLPPATSFLRLHSLDKHGDDLSSFRFTVVEANRRQRVVAGLERGRGGTGIRAVHPVMHEGRQVGTVEFGVDFAGEFVRQVASGPNDEAELYLFPAENVATFSAEDATEARVGDTLGAPPALGPETLELVRSGVTVPTRFEVDGRSYAGLATPVMDHAGAVAGAAHLAISTDGLAASAAVFRRGAAIGGATAVFLAVGLGFLFSGWIGGRLAALGRRMAASPGPAAPTRSARWPARSRCSATTSMR